MGTERRKAVLIVDDDPKHQRLIAMNFSSEGYRAITAENGEEALKMIQNEKPGIVLLDIMMPGIDGIEVLQRIKKYDPDIPVVMVSAMWDEKEAKRSLELGAYEYITKPIDFEHLKMVVLTKLFPDE
jgi:DNA-binding response OmpR family regulator